MLSQMLGLTYMGIAALRDHDDWLLTEPESKQFAGAIVPVLGSFKINIDPKVFNAFALVVVAATINGPRIKSDLERTKAPKETERPKPAPAMSFNQPANSTGFSDFGDPSKVN